MLNMAQSLIFPHLKRIADPELPESKEVTQPLYLLNWELFETDLSKNIPELRGRSIPATFDTMDNAIYAVSESYKAEIQRMSIRATEEWVTRYPFDTMVREICLEPAVAYVWTAFRLLADCVYDPATGKFSRQDDRRMLKYLLPYRFWRKQTGRGLTQSHARIWQDRMFYASRSSSDMSWFHSMCATIDKFEAKEEKNFFHVPCDNPTESAE